MRRIALLLALGALLLAAGAGTADAAGAGTADAAGTTADRGVRVIRDWPCAGCLVVLPRTIGRATPVLVALHGDEGSPDLMASVMGRAAAARGLILFAPHCPVARGCSFPNGAATTSSWWGWLQSGRYDEAWLGAQLGRVTARYRVQHARRFVAGWSGGADFLGWYALRHATTFSAAAFLAGGVPYYTRCPAAPLPAYFLLGAADPRYLSGQPGQVESVLRSCGSETYVDTVPNADHQATLATLWSGKAQTLVDWLLKHRRAAH